VNPSVAKCLLLSKVLVADGMMTDDERGFLEGVMTNLGLSADERRQVVELDGWDQAEPIVAALSLEERHGLVDLLVDAAAADGRLSVYELTAVKKLSAALGLAGAGARA
jgi:uncharacterized tellurite resistance protein B-like protein